MSASFALDRILMQHQILLQAYQPKDSVFDGAGNVCMGQLNYANPDQLSFESIWQSLEIGSPFVLRSPPVIRVQLVRDGSEDDSERAQVGGPSEIATVLRSYLEDEDREHFVTLMLDVKNRLIGVHTASIGTLNAALISPREVFKAAVLANAASIVLAHNHPSGDPSPSPEDHEVTERLRKVGALLDIEVLDHVIVGAGGKFVSLRQAGFFCGRPQF